MQRGRLEFGARLAAKHHAMIPCKLGHMYSHSSFHSNRPSHGVTFVESVHFTCSSLFASYFAHLIAGTP